jgi:Ca-activated chloride channel family protein
MFERPTWLIATGVVIAALAVLAWRARRSRAQRCRTLGVAANPWSRSRVFSIVAALVLLAGAAVGFRFANSPVATAAGYDIAFVIDISRSMLAKDAMPDRITRAKELAGEVVASLGAPAGNRVAVIEFASQPHLIAPLTYDMSFARTAIRDIEASATQVSSAKSGTRIGAAIEQAVRTLSAGRGAGMVLLFSDGDDPVNDGEWLRGAEVASEANIPVGVIGIGDPSRESAVPNRPDARTKLREATLREIATRTGGKYLAVTNSTTSVDQFARNMLTDRPRKDDPTQVTARTPQWTAPLLMSAFVFLTIGLIGMQWRIVAAAAVVATVSAGPVDDWLRRGDSALAAGRPEQALTWYKKAEGRAQDPGLLAFNEGVALAALGRYREAELHFQWCLSDAAGERRVRALYNLGTCLVRRCAGRERAAMQAAVTAFQQAQDAMTPTDTLADSVRENLAIAKDLLAQLPAEQPAAPGDGPSSEPEKPATTTQPGQSEVAKSRPEKNVTANGELPKSTDQAGPPVKGNLPPLADNDELTPITPQDFDEHLRRVVERVTAAKHDRLRAKTVDRPTNYPDW